MEIDKQKKNNIIFNTIAIICIIMFCFSITPVTLQNDTYYTIKIGEHITQNGIDMMDPFSWHDGLPYTYPHWLYDVLTYFIYNAFGFLGIYIATIVLCCILGLTLYATNCKISKNRLTSFIITLTIMWCVKPYIAARAQLVTFIFFVLSIYFIEMFIKEKKKRYAIGLIINSILIANLHVAVWPFFFIIFLPYIAEYIIALIRDLHLIYRIRMSDIKSKIKKLSKKDTEKNKEKIAKLEIKRQEITEHFEKFKQSQAKAIENPYKIRLERKDSVKWLILIMIICAFTGLLTPLGDTPYTYLVKTMQGNTTNSISEHQPIVLAKNDETLVLVTIVLAILIFTDMKIRLRDLFMVTGLAYLMIQSVRQFSMFALLGSTIFNKLVAELFEKYDKNGSDKFIKLMTTWVGRILTLAFFVLISYYICGDKVDAKIVDEKSYPVEAAKYIKENLDLENIKLYNEYNYGSYLLFEGIPVFIDSRADLYAPEFNGQDKDIFSDFINTSNINKYYEDMFSKYEITHVITYKNSRLNLFISRDNNYKELYSDESFVIYDRLTR